MAELGAGRRATIRHDPLAPQLREEVERLAGRWWLFLILGVAAVVIGTLLVIDVFSAVRALALLAGLSLLASGLLDFLSVDRFRPRWLGAVSGALLLGAGVLAIAWPKVTLWVIAVVTGVGLLAGGLLRTAGALGNRSYRGQWLLLIAGVVSVIAGVLALAWPRATILVLAVLLGVRTVVLGVVEIAFAFSLRRLRGDLT